MRIVAGVWAGKPLVSPGKRVRSTAEHVRDRWLTHLEPHLGRARVLDLFAGSGALGLEALSRGASTADFVENGSESLHALKANVAARKLHAPAPDTSPDSGFKTARVFKRDAIPFVGALKEGAYDVAFADPPYGSKKLDLVIERWLRVRFARILSVEHDAAHAVPPGGDTLDFGETVVTFYGLAGRGSGGRPRGVGKTPTQRAGKPPARRTRDPLQE